METNKIVKLAAYGFVGMVVVPTVFNVGTKFVTGAAKGVNKIVQNAKLKKGLKEGSIVEIDGQYYEVEITDAEEA